MNNPEPATRMNQAQEQPGVTPRGLPFAYMPQLDGLRAVAIAMVLFGHFHPAAASLFVPVAWAGVQLFFVLSGFLITSIVLGQRRRVEAGEISPSRAFRIFYLRRGLRLFPLYYLVIVLALVLDVELGRDSWASLVFYLVNVKMAVSGDWLGEFSHLWSLAAEEQFYLLWPLMVIFLRPQRLRWVLLMAIILSPLFRLAMVLTGQSVFSNLLLFGITDALGMGAVIAVWSHGRVAAELQADGRTGFFHWLPAVVVLVFAATLVMFASVEWTSPTFRVWASFLSSIPFAWVVWRAATGFRGVVGSFLASAPVVYVGKISYGIYILHAFVPGLLSSAHPGLPGFAQQYGLWFWLNVLTTIGLASVSWYLLERPANRLKSRFRY